MDIKEATAQPTRADSASHSEWSTKKRSRCCSFAFRQASLAIPKPTRDSTVADDAPSKLSPSPPNFICILLQFQKQQFDLTHSSMQTAHFAPTGGADDLNPLRWAKQTTWPVPADKVADDFDPPRQTGSRRCSLGVSAGGVSAALT